MRTRNYCLKHREELIRFINFIAPTKKMPNGILVNRVRSLVRLQFIILLNKTNKSMKCDEELACLHNYCISVQACPFGEIDEETK